MARFMTMLNGAWNSSDSASSGNGAAYRSFSTPLSVTVKRMLVSSQYRRYTRKRSVKDSPSL